MSITILRTTLLEHQAAVNARAGSSNVLVRLEGRVPDGTVLVGVGEAQLRTATGDHPRHSWRFLEDTAARLEGATFEISDNAASLSEICSFMASLWKLALDSGWSGAPKAPFRGSLLGVETALLDLIARALGVRLADLLSAQRGEVLVAPPASSLDMEVRALVPRCADADVVRLDMTDDTSRDLATLWALGRRLPRSTPWWLDARAALSLDAAQALVSELVDGMRRRRLPERIILEQPLGASKRRQMAQLQRDVDALTAQVRRRDLDLRIMADESLATIDDLTALTGAQGCRALNIKPGRIGGLLPAIDLVGHAVSELSDTIVALSGMATISDVSTWAMHHLAMALPRLDYFTSAPSKTRPTVTHCPPALVGQGRSLKSPTSTGLGVELRIQNIISSNGRYSQRPFPAGPLLDGRRAHSYPEEEYTRLLGKPAMRSHLVEREALAHGLSTTRYNPTAFVARGRNGTPLLFGASARSPISSAVSFVIADKHKGAAQALLERVGVPVPEGRIFPVDEVDSATAYARHIGYPVVSKPVGGTGGAAVTTHITGDTELARGFQAVQQSPRFGREDVLVQRHISGDVYRIMVQGSAVTAALMRTPPSVTGDGSRSVAELIIEKNAYRSTNPRLRKGPIDAARSADYLTTLGMSLDTVPPEGERIVLGADAYLNGGGDSIDVLGELHPTIADACITAVQAVPGLQFCGVDILLEDHRKDIRRQSAGVCELNSCPELITPQFPLFGEPRPVARQLLVQVASEKGVELPAEPASELAVRMVIYGHVTGVGYVSWFRRLAEELGLRGRVAEVDGQRRVEAVVAGPIVPVTVLASVAASRPGQARPESVNTAQTEAPDLDGFVIATYAAIDDQEG